MYTGITRACPGRISSVGFAALALLFTSFSFAEPYIIRDGLPQAEIVISPTPARMARLAASNLQEYLFKMTGATLAITNAPTESTPVKLYVGKSNYTDALNLSTNGLAHGAFRMASGTNWLALVGPDKDYAPPESRPRTKSEWDTLSQGERYAFPYAAAGESGTEFEVSPLDDRGTFNAVCEFLRNLGVRWYFPGDLGEVVPNMSRIALPTVNLTVRPDFSQRHLSFWGGAGRRPDVFLWNLRLGTHDAPETVGTMQLGHGQKWVLMREEVKQAHPEWYAIWGGRRATTHSYSGAPCLSSRGFFEQHLKFARWIFDVCGEPMLSLDPPDGYSRGVCQCELCGGQGTPQRGWAGAMSDYVWDYVRRASAALYASHPGKKVSGTSYGAYALPPEKIERFPPNLVLRMLQRRANFHDPAVREQFYELRRSWLNILPSGELYMIDHSFLLAHPRYGYGGVPVYFPRLAAADLRSLKGVSSGEVNEVVVHRPTGREAWDELAVMHLNIYATSRLWWDADQDIDALLDEFYELFYGPARAEMKAFIEFSEAHWPQMRRNLDPIGKALALLAAAQEAADPKSVYGRRVALVSDYLEPLRERKEMLTTYRQDTPRARAAERSSAGLTLDGHLDEPFWNGLPVYALRDLATGEPATVGTEFRVAWSDEDRSLIFGIRCAEPDMAGVVTEARAGETAIFDDDRIELFLETPFHEYYQIAVNAAGVVLDLDRGDSGIDSLWSSEAGVAVSRGDDFWSMEIRLPTADHAGGGFDPRRLIHGTRPTVDEPWFFNVGRSRPRPAGRQSTAFSPTETTRLPVPEKFGMLFVPPATSRLREGMH